MKALIALASALVLATSALAAPAAGPMTPIPEAASPAACCKVCTKGKPCGDSCIARTKTCHQPPGCACASPAPDLDALDQAADADAQTR